MTQFANVIQMHPEQFEAYLELGFVMHSLGERETARSWYLMALSRATSPASHRIQVEMGGVCLEMGFYSEAAEWFHRAVDSDRLSASDLYRAGAGMARMGRLSEAGTALKRSIAIAPTATACTELGFCQFRQGDVVSAEASYRQALRCDPQYAAAHANLALVLLYRGDYRAGFEQYEWRLKLDGFFRTVGFKVPRWAGEPLDGKTILLHAEQGYGDTLQSLRYIRLVASLGATVLLMVQPALQRLVRQYPGVARCLEAGESDGAGISFHCPLMSLPFAFGTSIESIPSLDPSALLGSVGGDRSRQGYPESSSQLRPLQVGLVWAGNREHLSDAERSVSLSSFQVLGDFARSSGRPVSFTSLQHGPAAKEIGHVHLPFPLHDGCSNVKDFADTAALVAGLDLVIAVDTAVAHLAGSMGKPVWVLLGSVPEWRWGAEGDTTPWYPTVRLFRSESEGGWQALFERLATAFTDWCGAENG
jgi:Tfp pilus assembly protein PilF